MSVSISMLTVLCTLEWMAALSNIPIRDLDTLSNKASRSDIITYTWQGN